MSWQCEQRLFLHESSDTVGFKVSKYSNFGMVMRGNSEILFLQPTVVPLNHAAFGAPFMDISDVELGGAPGARLQESRRSSRHYKGLWPMTTNRLMHAYVFWVLRKNYAGDDHC